VITQILNTTYGVNKQKVLNNIQEAQSEMNLMMMGKSKEKT